MTEHEEFALMLREALTEYDFEAIETSSRQAYVRLNREIYAEDGKEENPEFKYTDKAIIGILAAFKDYMPLV